MISLTNLLHEMCWSPVEVDIVIEVRESGSTDEETGDQMNVVPGLHLGVHGGPGFSGDAQLINGGSGPVRQSLATVGHTHHRAGSEKNAGIHGFNQLGLGLLKCYTQ